MTPEDIAKSLREKECPGEPHGNRISMFDSLAADDCWKCIADAISAALLERDARWGQAVGQLCDGFDHVRTCRICGEEDAKECDQGGMEAVAAREAIRALLEEAGK